MAKSLPDLSLPVSLMPYKLFLNLYVHLTFQIQHFREATEAPAETTTATAEITTTTEASEAEPTCSLELVDGIYRWKSPDFGISNYPDNFQCGVQGSGVRSLMITFGYGK